jgi:hypothetical protein
MRMTKPQDQQSTEATVNDASHPIDSHIDKSNNPTSTYNFDFLYQVQPVHLIFFASMPLCLGAFAGYKVEMNRVASASAKAAADNYSPGAIGSGGGLLQRVMGEELNITASEASTKATTSAAESLQLKQVKMDVGRIAFKALGIGSMLSVGGVGLLTAGIFKVSGCDSLEDMIQTWRVWTPRKRRELEEWLGVDPKSNKHEDVVATRGMTEGEEWEFIKKKYIPELVDGDGDGGNVHENNDEK